MSTTQVVHIILATLGATLVLTLLIGLLRRHQHLFKVIKNGWLRRNLIVLVLAMLAMTCCMMIVDPRIILESWAGRNWGYILIREAIIVALVALILFNMAWLLGYTRTFRNLFSNSHHPMMIPLVVISAVLLRTTVRLSSKITLHIILLVIITTVLLALFIWLLSIYKRLFTGIRNIWLRRNITVMLLSVLGMSSCMVLVAPQLVLEPKIGQNWPGILAKELGVIAIIVLFVFNVVWLINNSKPVKNLSFRGQHAIVIPAIVLSTLSIWFVIMFIDQGGLPDKWAYGLLFVYFFGIVAAFIYAGVNYVEEGRLRKLNEKELELTRLTALKTKAELDALHSKVNPHFLYNALNSIADLSITDGRKARRMTIALADLFRYSINYSQNNYSTVNDEVAMTEVYLQIEKIRFEDQLNYSVDVQAEAGHFLVPRFILQPLVENAVKHGLKVTGKMTEILLSVRQHDNGLLITIADNGPAFPAEMMPGYGVKSVFDKLDLLFPGQYEIHFSNEPRKQVAIHIYKLMKNEPAV